MEPGVPTRHEDGMYDHDPSLEWPGGEIEEIATPKPLARSQILRFVVDRPSSVTGSGRIALVDGYDEVQIGRDVSPNNQTPRIRIKTMEVSKFHATVYWDSQQKEWAIVDMGSMHGTFVCSASARSSASPDDGQRLSTARTASVPRRLSHLDRIRFGTTGMIVHIHGDLACEECSPRHLKDEIPLFPSTSRSASSAPLPTSNDSRPQPYAKDSRKALTALKRNLLAHHNPPMSCSAVRETTPYVDRSARRRALYPSSASDAPGISSRPHSTEPATATPSPPIEPVSQAPTPLPPSNIGHLLLLKQGWQPGSSLGLSPEGGITEPLDGEAMAGGERRGLGMHK
ncbi:hypothetical protein BDZ89DRAFT_1058390 [Hymenopellis radicata]|nr:hypothetical protein BDZ89DRAFT_1058390 [Hymenopellis radicata]